MLNYLNEKILNVPVYYKAIIEESEENFKKLRKLDELKLKKCKKNGINVLYYTDLGYKTFLKEKIYTDKNELIKTIFTA